MKAVISLPLSNSLKNNHSKIQYSDESSYFVTFVLINNHLFIITSISIKIQIPAPGPSFGQSLLSPRHRVTTLEVHRGLGQGGRFCQG